MFHAVIDKAERGFKYVVAVSLVLSSASAYSDQEEAMLFGGAISNETVFGDIDGTNTTVKVLGDVILEGVDTSYWRFNYLTNQNQSIQYITGNMNEVTFQIPTTGETKDWIVYIYSSSEVALNFNYPDSTNRFWSPNSDVFANVSTNTPTAFYFSQVSDGLFIVGRQELSTVENVPQKP